jgi:diguanylate cyclase (GGDEF)-like protein
MIRLRQTGRVTALVLAASATLLIGSAFAATPFQYTFDVWDSSHGLPQSSVQSVTQSPDGYVWIGTMGGLARFDGLRFRVFDKRNTPLLGDNVIQALFSDEKRLWIGSRAGGLVFFENGEFRKVRGAEQLSVLAIARGEQGRTWIAAGDGLAVVEGAEKLRRIALPVAARGAAFLSLIRDRHGAMWGGTTNGVLVRIDHSSVRAWGPNEGMPFAAVRALAEGTDGSIWIGTETGLIRFDGSSFRTYTTAEGLPSDMIRALAVDHRGGLWVGTYGGLSRFDGERFTTFTRENSALPTGAIRALLHDREGNFWVGTGGGGLVRMKEAAVTTITDASGVPVRVVRSVMEASDRSLWIGTLGEGAIRIHEGRATVLGAEDLGDRVVHAFAEDHAGGIWIGTRKGVARWSNGSVRRYGEADGFPDRTVRALFVDRSGTLWLGTTDGALRFRDGRFERVGLASGRPVYFITQTRDGSIWMAVYGDGLHRLQGNETAVHGRKEGLPSTSVLSIYEDERGTLWVGTLGGGLIRFQDGRFHAFDVTRGLPDDVIYHVLEDDRGRLWMSGNKGVFAARRAELDAYADGRARRISSLTFDKAEGMVSSECNGANQPAGWRGHDGRLYFPTVAGVAVLDPARIAPPDVAPRALIESLIVNGKSIPAVGDVTIPPGASHVEIHFTGLLLSAPAERIGFTYRLSPLESEWIDGGNDRTARYTNLPPGRYRFQIAAAERGSNLVSEASLPFEIQPHAWQTLSFWAAVATAVIGIVALVAWQRIRRARLRERELRLLVAERTEELKSANARLEQQTRIDSLTGLANRRHFDEALEREWRRAIRDKAWISMILADVDQFKAYNDAYGHQSGDECLRKIAAVLKESAHRPGDLVARYGGEEFAIILFGSEPNHVARIAEQARAGVEREGIEHAYSSVSNVVTVSFGAASVRPHPGLGPEQLIALADELLYQSKGSGRNRTHSAILDTGNVESIGRSVTDR